MTTPNFDLVQILKMYQDQKSLLDKLTVRVEELKRELVNLVQEQGYVDDKGHQWLGIGDFQLKRERRVSVSFNGDYAEKWAKDNGFWDEVKEVKEVVSEEKLLATVWDDVKENDNLDSFYTKRESFAFKIVEGKTYDEE